MSNEGADITFGARWAAREAYRRGENPRVEYNNPPVTMADTLNMAFAQELRRLRGTKRIKLSVASDGPDTVEVVGESGIPAELEHMPGYVEIDYTYKRRITKRDREIMAAEQNVARAEAILRHHGIEISVWSGGCDGEAYVSMKYNGETILEDECDAMLSMLDGDDD